MTSARSSNDAYIDPDVAALLAAADPEAPDFCDLSPADARAASDKMIDWMLPAVDVASVVDLTIPTPACDIPARLYRPSMSEDCPLLVFFHGGGWELGSIDVADRPVRRLVNDSGAAVLSVGYRLAPEDPFPAALDDGYAAMLWARENAGNLGAGRSFFAVGGDSAGGNLAAAIAQLNRDRGGSKLDHQLLIYPVVSRDFETDSYEQYGSGYFLTRKTMQHFWRLYAGAGTAPPYADLYLSGSLASLPSATVFTCGLDPLRDEGETYAQRLAEAGVAVTLTRIYGLIHGSWFMDGTGLRAYQLGLDIAGALRRAISRAHCA